MKFFTHSETGSVSVYLILIIVPIFCFQAVLIDFARVRLAEKETDNAVKTGVRSTLSAFDPNLQQIGLYGLGKKLEESQSIFENVVNHNLSSNPSSPYFHYIDTRYEPNSAQIIPMYSLANHVIFEQQILEDMKYKAPIEFTLEIVDKFKKTGAASQMKKGAQFTKEADKLEKILDKREQALDDAWSHEIELHEKTRLYHTYYQIRIQELSSLADQIGLHTIDEVKQSLNTIREQLKTLRDSLQNLDISIASIASAVETDARAIQALINAKNALEIQINELLSKQNDLEKLLELILKYTALLALTKQEVRLNHESIVQLQNEIDPSLQAAKQANDEVNEELKRILSENTDGASSTNSSGNPSNVNQEAFRVFGNVKVLDEDFFRSYQLGVGNTAALFTGFHTLIDTIYLFTSENESKTTAGNDAYWNQSNEFYSRQNQFEQQRNQNNQNVKARKQEQINKIQAVLDQAKQAIGGCSTLDEQGGSSSSYQKLQGEKDQAKQGLYQKYQEINQESNELGSNVSFDLEKDKANKSSIKAMDLLDQFTDVIVEMRNELSLNEFALTKFNYRTFGLEKDGAGNLIPSHELSDPGKHVLPNQEGEYLLYGFSSCAANISTAYAEMFSFRLAILTVEALLEPRNEILNIGSPLLVLLVAASEGAGKALIDMNQLVKGESVPISSKLTNALFSFNYKDYLRIFLLLHSQDEKLMSRMQGLIELNTGQDLQLKSTYVQAAATTSIRLWFLPQMMKVLQATGIFQCRVNGNRCEISKTAVMAY